MPPLQVVLTATMTKKKNGNSRRLSRSSPSTRASSAIRKNANSLLVVSMSLVLREKSGTAVSTVKKWTMVVGRLWRNFQSSLSKRITCSFLSTSVPRRSDQQCQLSTDDDSFSPTRDAAQRDDKTNTITPLQQASKGSKVTPTPAEQDTKKKAKNNAIMMKKHQEWQEAANKAGGGRIVVSKDQAKPLIFQMLYDKMKPMNITQIYTVRVLSRVCAFRGQTIRNIF